MFERVAGELRRIAREEARNVSPSIRRYRVARANPLRLESLKPGDPEVLEEGDDDFEVQFSSALAVGDTVLVIRDDDGDYVAMRRKLGT